MTRHDSILEGISDGFIELITDWVYTLLSYYHTLVVRHTELCGDGSVTESLGDTDRTRVPAQRL